MAFGGAPSGVYGLAVLIPGIAVAIRGLHDTNRSGCWLLICMVLVIGTIVLLVFMVQDSQPDANQYGPNPKAARAHSLLTDAGHTAITVRLVVRLRA